MVAVIDYGVGNLFSLSQSLKFIGEDAKITGNKDEIANADRIILPGVGAFGDAAAKLRQLGLDETVCNEAKKGKPVLGICLGMQMLHDVSFEYGEYRGLSLIPGEVVDMSPELPENFKVPHIGWNALKFEGEKSKIYKYINEGDFVYFVHSYYARTNKKYISATVDYHIPITASVEYGSVYGTQFHPEKSGEVGLNILRAFCEIQ